MFFDQPVIVPDALLSRLSDCLESQMGLHFPETRWRDLERGIAAASRDAGQADVEGFIRNLLVEPLTRVRVEQLASHLTVGETYFFREKECIDMLEQHVLPELLRARAQGGKHLRIWSAGCCTGEEPYSIAILLDRLIPDLDEWYLTIRATDINPLFLRKAVQGVYGAWSFRSTPGWVKERYFSRRPDGCFEILPRIRRMVSFSYLNLAEDGYPSLAGDTSVMDVILCRNVLMYFAQPRVKAVIDNLQRSLADGGWLVTSLAETSSTQFSALATVEFPGVFLYRKKPVPERLIGSTEYPASEPGGAMEHEAISAVSEASMASNMTRLVPEGVIGDGDVAQVQDVGEHDAAGRKARACADEGRLAEAGIWCGKAIAADKLNPAHYYLDAVISQEQGRVEAAEHALGRALYLEPDFALAHFALGNLCLSGGRRREAWRHFDNALALLSAYPADALPPESDGLSAGRLVDIIVSLRAGLSDKHEAMTGAA